MERYFLILAGQKERVKSYTSTLQDAYRTSSFSTDSPLLSFFNESKEPFFCVMVVTSQDKAEQSISSCEYQCKWERLKQDNDEVCKSSAELQERVEAKSNKHNVACMNISHVAEEIHHLADRLPKPGSFLLDVLLDEELFATIAPSKHIELYGALLRLISWHGAVCTIIKSPSHTLSTRDEDSYNLADWLDTLHGRSMLQCDMKEKFHFPVWRGAIQFGVPNMNNFTVLHSFEFIPPKRQVSKWKLFLEDYIKKVRYTQSDNEGSLVTSHLQLVTRCRLETVPSYLIQPSSFSLDLPASDNVSDDSIRFLSMIKNDRQIGFIFRLSYVFSDHRADDDQLKTSYWMKMMMRDSIKTPIPHVGDNSKEQFFLVMADTGGNQNDLSDKVLVRPFLHPKALCLEYFHDLVTLPSPSTLDAAVAKEKVMKILSSLPCISPHLLSGIVAVTDEVIYKAFCQFIENEQQIDNLSDDHKKALMSVITTVQNVVHKKIFENSATIHCWNQKGVPCIPGLGDPSDWPERKYLLQKEFSATSSVHKSSSSTNLACSSMDTIITPKEVGQYFSETGEANWQNLKGKKSRPLMPLIVSNNSEGRFRSQMSHEEAAGAPWWTLRTASYHDLYYNWDESDETFETACNKLRDRYIDKDTVCLWSSPQQLSGSIVVKNSQRRSPLKTKHEQSNEVKSVSLRRSPRANKWRSLSAQKENQSQAETRRSTQAVPLRRSPRKHKASASQSLPLSARQTSQIISSKEHGDLSEHHKRKLRAAVADALDEQGIHLEHPLFKTCGRKLFTICKTFVKDIIGSGRTSALMKKIADSHVIQVVNFELQRTKMR